MSASGIGCSARELTTTRHRLRIDSGGTLIEKRDRTNFVVIGSRQLRNDVRPFPNAPNCANIYDHNIPIGIGNLCPLLLKQWYGSRSSRGANKTTEAAWPSLPQKDPASPVPNRTGDGCVDSYFLDLAKARLAGAFLLAETGRLLLVATAFLRAGAGRLTVFLEPPLPSFSLSLPLSISLPSTRVKNTLPR